MLPVTEIVEERSAHLSSLIPDGFNFPVAFALEPFGPTLAGFGVINR